MDLNHRILPPNQVAQALLPVLLDQLRSRSLFAGAQHRRTPCPQDPKFSRHPHHAK
jgi:hypothetical protein